MVEWYSDCYRRGTSRPLRMKKGKSPVVDKTGIRVQFCPWPISELAAAAAYRLPPDEAGDYPQYDDSYTLPPSGVLLLGQTRYSNAAVDNMLGDDDKL